MALQAAFIFLVGDADENTRTVVSTPSINLNVVGVGAVKFDFHPGLGFKSGDALFG